MYAKFMLMELWQETNLVKHFVWLKHQRKNISSKTENSIKKKIHIKLVNLRIVLRKKNIAKLCLCRKTFGANGDKHFLRKALALLFFNHNLHKWGEYFSCNLPRGKLQMTFTDATYLALSSYSNWSLILKALQNSR